MAPSSQELEPPANPERFRPASRVHERRRHSQAWRVHVCHGVRPQGLHNTELVNHYRRTFRDLESEEERIAYAEAITDRRWHRGIPFATNCKNLLRNLLNRPKWGFKIGVLDMMMPFYNWTIPLDVAVR